MLTLHQSNHHHRRPAHCRRGCVRAVPARIAVSLRPLRTAAAFADKHYRHSRALVRYEVDHDLGNAR